MAWWIGGWIVWTRWATKRKTPYFPLDRGRFIGILIMTYYKNTNKHNKNQQEPTKQPINDETTAIFQTTIGNGPSTQSTQFGRCSLLCICVSVTVVWTKGELTQKQNDCPIILFVLEIPYDNVISCTSKHDTYDMILSIEEIPNNHLGSIPNHVNDGISTTKPQLVVRHISSINSMTIPKLFSSSTPLFPWAWNCSTAALTFHFRATKKRRRSLSSTGLGLTGARWADAERDRHKWREITSSYTWPSINGWLGWFSPLLFLKLYLTPFISGSGTHFVKA